MLAYKGSVFIARGQTSYTFLASKSASWHLVFDESHWAVQEEATTAYINKYVYMPISSKQNAYFPDPTVPDI